MPDLERHRNAPVPGWPDAGMPVPAESALMPIPTYVRRRSINADQVRISFINNQAKILREGVAEKALLNECFVRTVQYSIHTING